MANNNVMAKRQKALVIVTWKNVPLRHGRTCKMLYRLKASRQQMLYTFTRFPICSSRQMMLTRQKSIETAIRRHTWWAEHQQRGTKSEMLRNKRRLYRLPFFCCIMLWTMLSSNWRINMYIDSIEIHLAITITHCNETHGIILEWLCAG